MVERKDFMLDLETLGLSNNSVVIQLALVEFDLIGEGGYGKRYIDLAPSIEEQIELGRTIEPEAINFWVKTNPKLLCALMNKPSVSLDNTLYAIKDFIGNKDNKYIWSRGQDFDFAIVKELFKKSSLPWKYNAGRDTRTVIDLAELLFDHKKPERDDYLVEHDAYSDCLYQIKELKSAINLLTRQ